MSERPRAVIIGGGLAGMSAAVRLAQSGVTSTVLEKRPFLGGRAFSFVDPETGVEVDNGQHVFVGACTEFRQYLSDIDALNLVNLPRRLDARVIKGDSVARLKASEYLPGPLANLPVVLGYGHLKITDRLRTLYGLSRVRMARRIPGGPLERETFDSWLRRYGQTDMTIRHFWNVIVLPALNDDISVVSADAGLMLFQTSLFGVPENAAIGYPTVGLTKLAGAPARTRIEQLGGEVTCGADVELIEFTGNRVSNVRTSDGQVVTGDVYVSALPAAGLLAALPDDLVADGFYRSAAITTTSPIVGVHIWYDRAVMTDAYVAVLDSPVQWVFNVSRMHTRDAAVLTPVPGSGQHLVISLSGAWQWRDMSKADLQELFLAEMARLFPLTKNAQVTRSLIVKMLDATFRVTPGSGPARLPHRTPSPNFFLAGDWTATGWPSTMESAVRSGNRAAGHAISYLRSMSRL